MAFGQISRQQRAKRRFDAFAEHRGSLDSLAQEAFYAKDAHKLALLQQERELVNRTEPKLALTYDYGVNRLTLRHARRYGWPPHRPAPKIPFLPIEAVEMLESPVGVEAVSSWTRIFSKTLQILGDYHKDYAASGSQPEDWEDFGNIVSAQQTSIRALGQRLCVISAVEIPPELDDY